MEKILRQCYKEKEIIRPNSIVFQNRINAIDGILENEILDETEWKILTNWMFEKGNQDAEDILIKLEECFCQEDTDFTIENNKKELQILAGILVYKYSKSEGNYLLPMMVICEYHSGDRAIGECLYRLFMQYIDEMRLSMRHPKHIEIRNYSMGANQLKKSIMGRKRNHEEEGTSFSYNITEIDTMVDLLEKCENNFMHMMQREQYLVDELNAQKEETDIAWWLLNEWSKSYYCPFSDLKIEEVVLAVPVELYNLNQYALGPYAARQVIYRGISHWKKRTINILLESFVNVVKDKVTELKLIDIENMELERVQPILTALKCMYECKESTDEQAWKAVFEGRTRRKVAELKMSIEEFAYQLYLELELAYIQVEVDD